MDNIGRMRIGSYSVEKGDAIKKRIIRRAELNRDESRRKLLESRKKYQAKVKQNEAKMVKRKKRRAKLGPTCVSLMESKEKEKQRHSAIGSLVPLKPKFSEAKNHPPRIYGRRFELVE